MTTPWGEIPILDSHVHFFSHSFYTKLSTAANVGGLEALGLRLGWEIPEEATASLAQRWIKEMDAQGVQRAALIGSLPGEEDSVAEAVSAFPDRFYGYFLLDPLQPDAAGRMERAGANPHLHCVCLFPAMHRYSLSEARVRPFFEIAERSRLAVFVHCGALSVGFRKKLGLPSPFDLRFSSPLELHPIALQFPGVRFIVPHFGAGMFREALMVADLCPNVFLDTSSSNRWRLYDGLDLRSVFSRCLDLLGSSRLLFGTDSSFFPRGWQREVFQQQVEALREAGAGAEDAARIFGGNLQQLYAPA